LTTINGDVPTVRRFKQTVTTKIKRWFNPDGSDIIAKVSSVLDPRYLQLKFLTKGQQSAVVRRLKLKVKEVESEDNDESMMIDDERR